jgi:hypothetical protein
MWSLVIWTIIRAVLTALAGSLITAGTIKANQPTAFSAPMGLSSTGLYVAAAFCAGFWIALNPAFGVNLLGRIDAGLKEWVRSCFRDADAK